MFKHGTLVRIFDFIESVSRRTTWAAYVRCFVLHYVYYPPDSLIAGAAKLVGMDKRPLLDDADDVRRRVAERAGGIMEKRMNAAALCYYRLERLQSHRDAHDQAELRETERRLRLLQEAALGRLRAV